MGFPKIGVPLGDPHNKDYSIFGSMFGHPHCGKFPRIAKKMPRLAKQITDFGADVEDEEQAAAQVLMPLLSGKDVGCRFWGLGFRD